VGKELAKWEPLSEAGRKIDEALARLDHADPTYEWEKEAEKPGTYVMEEAMTQTRTVDLRTGIAKEERRSGGECGRLERKGYEHKFNHSKSK
jgi:hypothetical protein